MKGKILFVVALFFTAIIHVKAAGCTNVEHDILTQLANNVTTALLPVTDEDGTQHFKVVFVGVHPDLRIILTKNYTSYTTSSTTTLGEIELDFLPPGDTYQFYIRGFSTCYNNTLRTVTITIPKFNNYSLDPLCEQARDFGMCQKWVKVDADYETFKEKVTKYIESKVEKKETVTAEKKFSFYDFYRKYYIYCLIFLIGIYILLEYLWVRKNKKERL